MCISVELYEAFDCADKINIYNDGEVTVYHSEEKQFDEILVGWKALIENAHDMPAFGVSLNSETRKALKSGVWVEFVFDKVYESNGMPYKKLLINVKGESSGFNLIRYSLERGYDGRCFYYDLVGRNMGNFLDILLDL